MDNNDNRNNKIKLGILALLLLLLIGSCGLLNGRDLFKKDNSLTVEEKQDTSLTYSNSEQSESFIGASEGEGEITYTLIRALDEKGVYVDYFSLLNDRSTQVIVAANTPAGTYELLIRATASGDEGHKALSKEFTVLITVGKAPGTFDVLPTPIEGLVYNGELQDVINPGQSNTGTIYYKVDDGEWSEKVPQLKEAGTYTIYYKLVGDRNHSDVGEQSFTVTIEKANVGNKPVDQTVEYDGLRHTLNYMTPAHVNKQGNASGIDAGEYKATYTPEANYFWNDGTNGPVTATLTIKKATATKPGSTDVVKTYNGLSQNNGYNLPDGVNMSGVDHGTDAGTYVAEYTPDHNHMWNDGTSDTIRVTLTINKATVQKPANTDIVKTYNGSLQNNDYDRPNGVNMSGVDQGTKAGTYVAEYTPDKNHVWSDGTSDTITVTLTIEKAKVAVPVIAGIDGISGIDEVEYDGRRHRAFVSEYDHTLIRTRNENARRRNAGEYTITASLKDKENYEWADGGVEDRQLIWRIGKIQLRLPVVWKSFTYKPNYVQKVKESDLLFYNRNLMYISANEGHIDAGEYTISVALRDKRNYCWKTAEGTSSENQEISWTINKARNPIELDSLQLLTTKFSFKGQSVAFALPENYQGEVSYEVKSARYAGTAITTDNISILDDMLYLEPETSVGIYTVVVGVHASESDNYKEFNGEIRITLTVEILDYLIRFDGNGEDVTGEVEPQHIYTSVVGWVLNRNQFEREHYNFVGWNSDPNGEGQSFEDGQYVSNRDLYPYEDNGTITLYAQWERKPVYTVYFIDTVAWSEIRNPLDFLNVITNIPKAEIDEGDAYGDDLPAVAKAGYEYGWYTLLGERISSDSKVKRTIDIDVSAFLRPLIEGIVERTGMEIPDWITNGIIEAVERMATGNNTVVLISRGTPNANTLYTVEHYVQNLSEDGHNVLDTYELLKSETRFATTDATITDGWVVVNGKQKSMIYKNITGFMPEYDKQAGDSKVNGDGSSVVKLYYERDMFGVDFDSRGGSDAEYQVVPYNGLAIDPGAPDFEGHTFSGWYYNGRPFDFNSRIKGAITITAMWDLGDVVNVVGKSSDPTAGIVKGSGVYELDDEVILTAVPYNADEFEHRSSYRFVKWSDGNTDNPRSFTVKQEDLGTIKEFVAEFAEVDSRSLVNIGRIEINAKAGDEVDVTEYFRNLLLVSNYTYSDSRNIPFAFEIDKSIFGSKAIVKIDDDAMPGSYQSVVTVNPYLLDLSHDKSFVNIVVNVKGQTHKVSFNANGGTPVVYQTIADGEYAYEPATTRTGYDFFGWYALDQGIPANERFDFENTPIVSDMELIAMWRMPLTVSFDLNGGNIDGETTIDDLNIHVSDKIDRPVKDPTREGYTFIGWYLGEEEFDFDSEIFESIVLTAKWAEGIKYRISVAVQADYEDMGEVLGGGLFAEGEKTAIRAIPNSEYRFVKWLLEDDPDFESTDNPLTVTVREDETYLAVFEKYESALLKYNERYYFRDSSLTLAINLNDTIVDLSSSYEYEKGPEPNNPLSFVSLFRTAYLYVGTNPKPGIYTMTIIVSKGDQSEVLKLTVEIGCRVVFYDLLTEVVVRKNEKVARPADPTRSGYIFAGWYNGDVEFDFDQPITDNITLSAKWLKAYEVTFDSNNGSGSFKVDVAEGYRVDEPERPEYVGHSFAGWFRKDGETIAETAFDFNTPIESDITLQAMWNKQIAVEFDSDGGTAVASQTVNEGDKAVRPADPAKAGYDFAGWYLGEEEFDFDRQLDSDIRLTAKWTPREYQVVYDSKGGTSVAAKYPVGWLDNDLAAEHNPSSYNPLEVFTGWYLDEECTVAYRDQTYAEIVRYNDDDMSVTLYAGWFDRGIIRYTAEAKSVEGEAKPYNIKENGGWYLLLNEYEIITGHDSDMFRMSPDNRSIIITDQAKPGTYYVTVTAKLSSLLDLIGIGSFDITDYIDLPIDLDEILSRYSQTIMIKWTVEAAEPVEEDPDAVDVDQPQTYIDPDQDDQVENVLDPEQLSDDVETPYVVIGNDPVIEIDPNKVSEDDPSAKQEQDE